MKAKEFKEQFKQFLSDEDFNFVFHPDVLKTYHEKVCNEMKQKIAIKLGILNIDEVENIEF